MRLPVTSFCIDSGGHRTTTVYDFCAKHAARRVYAIIGRDGQRPIVSSPSPKHWGKVRRKVPLYTVGVDSAKALLVSRMKLTEKGPGYFHIPVSSWCGRRTDVCNFDAENLVTRMVRGMPKQEWVLVRRRNDALDCAVYAIAALRLVRPDLNLLAQRIRGEEPKQAEKASPEGQQRETQRAPWIAPRPGWIRQGPGLFRR